MASGSLSLSADDLRILTKWPDSVIVEFLSLQAGVENITQNINIVINNTDVVMALEAQSSARITALSREIDQIKQSVEVIGAAAANVSARISAQSDQIASIMQQVAETNASLLARLNREIGKREELEQLVMAGN